MATVFALAFFMMKRSFISDTLARLGPIGQCITMSKAAIDYSDATR